MKCKKLLVLAILPFLLTSCGGTLNEFEYNEEPLQEISMKPFGDDQEVSYDVFYPKWLKLTEEKTDVVTIEENLLGFKCFARSKTEGRNENEESLTTSEYSRVTNAFYSYDSKKKIFSTRTNQTHFDVDTYQGSEYKHSGFSRDYIYIQPAKDSDQYMDVINVYRKMFSRSSLGRTAYDYVLEEAFLHGYPSFTILQTSEVDIIDLVDYKDASADEKKMLKFYYDGDKTFTVKGANLNPGYNNVYTEQYYFTDTLFEYTLSISVDTSLKIDDTDFKIKNKYTKIFHSKFLLQDSVEELSPMDISDFIFVS